MSNIMLNFLKQSKQPYTTELVVLFKIYLSEV